MRRTSNTPRPVFATLIAAALSVSCGETVAPSAQQTARPWALDENGLGPIRIGMTEAEVEQATGWQFSADDGGNPPDCKHIRAAEDESLALMMTDGRVSRVNISGGGRATTRGVRVGNTEDVVRRAYPRLEEGVDAGGAPTLTWWSSRDKGVRFDIDGDRRVYEMYGGNDAIALSEGCS